MSITITNLGQLQFTCVNAVSMIVVVTSSRFENSDQRVFGLPVSFFTLIVHHHPLGYATFVTK